MAPKFTFIGLGQMGTAISENIFNHGSIERPMTLYNRSREKADSHAQKLGNCIVADSIPAAVSASEIIWLCLQDREAVEQIFGEMTPADMNGKLFVDSSTISPGATNAIAERVCHAGGEFVALPVMGAPPLALKRSLICIAGGKAESVERVRPYLQGVIGRHVIELSGEAPGSAQLLKLMGNFLIMATIETVAEVNVFAEKCKIGTGNMNKLLSAMFPEPPHALYNRQMLNVLANEVMDLAKECGASVKIYETALEHLKDAERHAGPNADITGIYGSVRLQSGLTFESGL